MIGDEHVGAAAAEIVEQAGYGADDFHRECYTPGECRCRYRDFAPPATFSTSAITRRRFPLHSFPICSSV